MLIFYRKSWKQNTPKLTPKFGRCDILIFAFFFFIFLRYDFIFWISFGIIFIQMNLDLVIVIILLFSFRNYKFCEWKAIFSELILFSVKFWMEKFVHFVFSLDRQWIGFPTNSFHLTRSNFDILNASTFTYLLIRLMNSGANIILVDCSKVAEVPFDVKVSNCIMFEHMNKRDAHLVFDS